MNVYYCCLIVELPTLVDAAFYRPWTKKKTLTLLLPRLRCRRLLLLSLLLGSSSLRSCGGRGCLPCDLSLPRRLFRLLLLLERRCRSSRLCRGLVAVFLEKTALLLLGSLLCVETSRGLLGNTGN